MSPAALDASIVLASYTALNVVVSAIVAGVWRAGLIDRDCPAPATRAWRLTMLRATPVVVSGLLTAVVVTPGYLAFEPPQDSERAGPLLLVLAAVGAALLMVAVLIAWRAVIATRRLERAWLRSASPIEFEPSAGMPAYVVDTLAPIVALIGVFSPKLVAARSVIAVCSGEELAHIVAHERGHWRSRDNLKRWLMASAPDVLRWTPFHAEIQSAWHDAAEDAADDAATSGEVMARADLAALLVKIAGLAPTAQWASATVSPFVEADGLERRVRRLLEDDAAPAPSMWPAVARVAGVGGALLMIGALFSANTLQAAHEVVETLVDLGR